MMLYLEIETTNKPRKKGKDKTKGKYGKSERKVIKNSDNNK